MAKEDSGTLFLSWKIIGLGNLAGMMALPQRKITNKIHFLIGFRRYVHETFTRFLIDAGLGLDYFWNSFSLKGLLEILGLKKRLTGLGF